MSIQRAAAFMKNQLTFNLYITSEVSQSSITKQQDFLIGKTFTTASEP